MVEDNDGQSRKERAAALDAVTSLDQPDLSGVGLTKTAGFKAQTFGVVRPSHAQQALSEPDTSVQLEFEDTRAVLVTKETETPKGHFTLLCIGASAKATGMAIHSAYRLYGEADAVREWSLDSKAAFLEFLNRYCLPFEHEGKRVLFLPILTVPDPGDPFGLPKALGIETSESLIVSTSARRNSADKTLSLAWPFVVSKDRYLADIP